MLNNNTKNINSLIKNLALNYVAKYFTTSYKLQKYLITKLKKLNLYNQSCNDIINNIINEFAEKKYIDDNLYAKSKTISLIKKGKSSTYINLTLKQNKLASNSLYNNNTNNLLAALLFLKKRKLGCFSSVTPTADITIKTKQKLYTAGFSTNIINQALDFNIKDATTTIDNLLQQLNNI